MCHPVWRAECDPPRRPEDFQIRTELKISVVMPSYNQGEFLEEAINSILAQNYSNIELVVIDGGSTDNSTSILEKYDQEIAYWVSEPDGGQSNALNKGFAHTTGEVVGWLNSDDVYRSGTFRAVADVFANPDIHFAMCSRFGFIDASGNPRGQKSNRYTDYATLIRWWATDGMTINQPSVFFRRALIENLDSAVDEGLHCAMDYDLWLRLARDHELIVVDGHWADYRYHDRSKTVEAARRFVPEWRLASQRHWGSRHSLSWWRFSVDYWWHWRLLHPMKVIAGKLRGRTSGR